MAEAPPPDLVEFVGLVSRSLANDLFEVRLADGRLVLAHLAPAARLTALRVGAGDRVRVALARTITPGAASRAGRGSLTAEAAARS